MATVEAAALGELRCLRGPSLGFLGVAVEWGTKDADSRAHSGLQRLLRAVRSGPQDFLLGCWGPLGMQAGVGAEARAGGTLPAWPSTQAQGLLPPPPPFSPPGAWLSPTSGD